jgi:2'-5' RNA ligase/exonuclease III
MASPPQFRLTSTQTALAFVLPSHLHTEIDSLRRLYDKSFRKWDPHINILYPFVDPSCLLDVISKLGSFLSQRRSFSGNINDVGVFHHRRNATVFKKPNSDFGDELCRLRGELAAALGCPETEGTHDGIYRPHMTIGQAGLAGDSVEKLVDLVGKLVALRVNVKSLTVLQRDAFGNMKVVEELPLRSNDQLNSAEEEDKDQPSDAISSIWRPCHAFSKDTNWEQSLGTQLEVAEGKKQKQITISTYNIMAEPLAAPFTERLPYIKNAISSIIKESAPFKVLCLQEVSDESLSQLLSDPLIQDSFPFSSHSSTSLLPNHRNLVTLASARFVQFTLQFTELHKSSLVVYFPSEGIEVANVHLSAGLADQAVASKGSQMETLTEFLHESQKEYNTEVILAGDFNLTTSSRTIQTALATGVISPATADALPNIIDETIWDDCFIIYKDASDYDENIFPGEEGATYDRLTNPFAMGFKSPLGRSVDDSPQRYDRVLFRKSERLHPKTIERFGLPDERGKCGSDHYGVCASIQIRGSEEVPTSVEKLEETASIEFPNIERVDDGTDLLPLLEPHLPTDSDRQQREDAIQLLRDVFIDHEILGGLLFAFLGSYLLDTYSPASDIDLLVIGQASQQAFFDFAESRLRAGATHNISTGHEIRELRVVKSLVPVMKVVIAGIKFDLQYCRAQELWERYIFHPSIPLLRC